MAAVKSFDSIRKRPMVALADGTMDMDALKRAIEQLRAKGVLMPAGEVDKLAWVKEHLSKLDSALQGEVLDIRELKDDTGSLDSDVKLDGQPVGGSGSDKKNVVKTGTVSSDGVNTGTKPPSAVDPKSGLKISPDGTQPWDAKPGEVYWDAKNGQLVTVDYTPGDKPPAQPIPADKPADTKPPAAAVPVIPPSQKPGGFMPSERMSREEFAALPNDVKLQLLGRQAVPGTGGGGAYGGVGDPRFGTWVWVDHPKGTPKVGADGKPTGEFEWTNPGGFEWQPYDYSDYATLLPQMGKQMDVAGKYGQQVAEQFEPGLLAGMEEAAKTNPRDAYIASHLTDIVRDPGSAAYSVPNRMGRNGPADPINNAGMRFDWEKEVADKKANKAAVGDRAAIKARMAAARGDNSDDTPALAEGTGKGFSRSATRSRAWERLKEELPALAEGTMEEEKPKAPVAAPDEKQSAEDAAAVKGSQPEYGGMVTRPPQHQRPMGGRITSMRGTGQGMAAQSAMTQQAPASAPRENDPLTGTIPGSGARSANSYTEPVQAGQYNPPPVAQPGAESPIFVNQNQPHPNTSSQPGGSFPEEWRVLTPAFNGTEDPAQVAAYNQWKAAQNQPPPSQNPPPTQEPPPSQNPPPQVEDLPADDSSDQPNTSELTLGDVAAFNHATTGDELASRLHAIFGGNIALDPAKVLAAKSTISMMLMQVTAGLITKAQAATKIFGDYIAGGSSDPAPAPEQPPSNDGPDTEPDDDVDDAPAPEEDNPGGGNEPPPGPGNTPPQQMPAGFNPYTATDAELRQWLMSLFADRRGPQGISYDPTVWQNMPGLQYANGQISEDEFNRVGSAPTTNPILGYTVNGPSTWDYRTMRNLARRPVSWQNLSDMLLGVNRDLGAEAAMTIDRVPGLGPEVARFVQTR